MRANTTAQVEQHVAATAKALPRKMRERAKAVNDGRKAGHVLGHGDVAHRARLVVRPMELHADH